MVLDNVLGVGSVMQDFVMGVIKTGSETLGALQALFRTGGLNEEVTQCW